MASSPDGNGVLLFGGYDGSTYPYTNNILELKSDDQGWVGSWSILTTKLKYERAYHVVIPVVMDIDTCGINGIVYSNTGKYPSISNIICHQNSEGKNVSRTIFHSIISLSTANSFRSKD